MVLSLQFPLFLLSQLHFFFFIAAQPAPYHSFPQSLTCLPCFAPTTHSGNKYANVFLSVPAQELYSNFKLAGYTNNPRASQDASEFPLFTLTPCSSFSSS